MEGLGYPSRADRLQAACREVVEQRDGQWPQTAAEWQELPGIGPYTSAAVACFAGGEAVAVVDTNVARVYARRDGLDLPINKKQLQLHAEKELYHQDPISYNNALMELGALVCTARNPDCTNCPWRVSCESRHLEERIQLTSNPLKVASTKKQYGAKVSTRGKKRLPIVLALIHDEQGKYLIAQRPQGVPEAGNGSCRGASESKGEDDRTALAREVQEELGVELMSARPFLRWDSDAGDTVIQFHCYRCRLMQPDQAAALASDELRWVTPEQWLQMDFPQANDPLREKFADYHRIAWSKGGS